VNPLELQVLVLVSRFREGAGTVLGADGRATIVAMPPRLPVAAGRPLKAALPRKTVKRPPSRMTA
jgi:hypothetical protein